MKRQSLSPRRPLIARLAALALSLVLVALPLAARAEVTLVMVEEEGCIWCEKWNKEVGPVYPKTPEGKAAPLRRVELNEEPDDIEFAKGVHFTPTFVLVRDGVELARIEGYPGEEFFWGLLGQMLESEGVSLTAPEGESG